MRSYRYGKRNYRNHNRLLGRVSGVDGIKTGYTRASGFNLTTSTKRNGKRVVAVVMGGKTGRSRNAYMTNLINRMFRTKRLTRGKHLALVAGSPPGYVRQKATQVAKVSKPAPKPRAKPETESDELAKIADDAAIASMAEQPAEQPKPATSEAASEKPEQPKAFVSVEVPPLQPIDETQTSGDEQENQVAAQATPLTVASISDAGTPATVGSTVAIKDEALKDDDGVAKEADLTAHLKTWNIQIGAFPTREGAESRLDIAKHSLKRSIVGKKPFMMPTEKNGKTLYRARISGFDKQSAKRACKTLSRKGLGCFALAPKS